MASGLQSWRRRRHQEELSSTLTEVAKLEGRLMAAHDLDIEEVKDRFYGDEYLTPWERYDVLLNAAAEAGV
jgi:hypothetical protein